MTTIIVVNCVQMPIPSRHKMQIAKRFGQSAAVYEQHAELQRHIAQTLGRILPTFTHADILEIGCGTGLLTRHLIKLYPNSELYVTDIVPEMVALCQAQYGHLDNVTFAVMDGEVPACTHSFDLIASSMTIHWFDDCVSGLAQLRRCLAKDGVVAYATIGQNCFPEWRDVLRGLGLANGLRKIPNLPGLCHTETLTIDYGSGLDFLRSLKIIGADRPHAGYVPLSQKVMRQALKRFDKEYGGRITWHIAYGMIEAN